MRILPPGAVRHLAFAAALAAGLPLAAQAQSPEILYVRSVAASCAACHGTGGHVIQGSAMPGLAGMPREAMLRDLQAFRDGSRPATVMHQIAKGYTPAQLEQIAAYFAAQKK